MKRATRNSSKAKAKIPQNISDETTISETCKDIKTEQETSVKEEIGVTEGEKKPTKFDLSNFEFKREKKTVLASSSPKKRQHIDLEYDDDVSGIKVKKEEEKTNDLEKNVVHSDDGKPLEWETVLENIRKMREKGDAPVDSMGYFKCPDETAEPQVSKIFTVCIFLYISNLIS